MSCCELEVAVLIPAKKIKYGVEETKTEPVTTEPYFRYKGSEYKKTIRLKVPAWEPIKSKLKRFYNWLCFVWCHSRARKCRKITFLTLFLIFLVLFLIIFVLIPLAFKYSTSFQQRVVFDPIINTHESYSDSIEFRKDYDDVRTYYKPKNTYVVVNKMFNITLGLWSLAGSQNNSVAGFEPDNQDEPSVKVPYLIYFHDFIGDRRTYTKVYNQLMHYFHVIAFDYRSFADSSEGNLSEENLVSDSVQLYKWLSRNVNSSIFVWGNRLGAAVAARTVLKLQQEKIEPLGLILENPVLSTSNYLKHNWFIANMVSYTFWYKQTITDALEESDLSFLTKDNIDQINCPIMFSFYGRQYEFEPFGDIGYITYNDFDSKQEHIRVQAEVSYYFNYDDRDNSLFSSISNFIRSSNSYRENRNKQ